MLEFEDGVEDLRILDEEGRPLQADDHQRRFFEAPWMHKYQGKYYFSYSTGDTHYLVYATGDRSPGSVYVPRKDSGAGAGGGRRIIPSWSNQGRWWLFYHDCELSKGVDHLRSVKVREIVYDEKGKMRLAD